LAAAGGAQSGDWPQWRYDAGRGAATPEALPDRLYPSWVRELAPPCPAWPASQPRLRFDLSYSPVAAGKQLFVPSMVSDSVTALDTETGQERWRFYADGPVRFAPIAAQGRVYFASDDGFLYCLDAADGHLVWRVRGGPSDRRVLGSQRLISTWPIHGGPVLLDGKIYFTAGIWPFMGIFVHAIDAASGQSIWVNSGEAMRYVLQPHDSPAFGTFVPRGHLAATRYGLVAPGGRTDPAVYDLRTGEMLHFNFGAKGSGSCEVAALGPWLLVSGTMRRIADGRTQCEAPPGILEGNTLYALADDAVRGSRLVAREVQTAVKKGDSPPLPERPGGCFAQRGTVPFFHQGAEVAGRLQTVWIRSLPQWPGQLFLKAGPRFYAGSEGRVTALEADPRNAGKARVAWSGSFDGQPWTMLAADQRLFVVTTAGRIYAFAGSRNSGAETRDLLAGGQGLGTGVQSPGFSFPISILHAAGNDTSPKRKRAAQPDPSLALRASVRGLISNRERYSPQPPSGPWQAVLQAAGNRDGYCLLFGLGPAGLAEDLVASWKGQVIVVDPDAKKVEAFRRQMDDAGWYGTRAVAHVGQPATFALPPYLAMLVVIPEPRRAGFGDEGLLLENVARTLHPYGGAACWPFSAQIVQRMAGAAGLAGVEVRPVAGGGALLVRSGGLPGAGEWTHQYADAANSVCSTDTLVKAPLGLLWYGGPPNDEVLPRHGHGPSPQVAGGRLVIEGRDMLRALDIYTGRLLWQRQFPDLGQFYDNLLHQPGAGQIGSNYVTLSDAVYVVYRDAILALDAASGSCQREFRLPGATPGAGPPFGFLAAWDDLLIATSSPVATPVNMKPQEIFQSFVQLITQLIRDLRTPPSTPSDPGKLLPAAYGSSSRRLVVFDRHSGRLLWDRAAKYSFRHNNIVIGGGKLFAIDSLPADVLARLKRRGVTLTDYQPRLTALDVRTGRELWSTGCDVFGTTLSYSIENDILLEGGSAGRDRAPDEVSAGMVAFLGRSGCILWRQRTRRYNGPCLLHHDTIFTQGPAFSLLTGQPVIRRHPLTGEPMPWKFTRNHGCNTAVACENLLTFRSAAAGFYDLAQDGGTGNLGGFKSSCTSNLIVAGGLLNAPEYTRTCTCNYPNQTSLALVHDPDAEMWTFNDFRWDGRPVRRVGLNFGAPGDRRADDGTLWLDYPSRGGPSPDLPVTVQPADVHYFCHHSSRVQLGAGSARLPWVAASGVTGVRRVSVTLAAGHPRPRCYRVRLHFAEVEQARPGDRVFGISLQQQEVLRRLDVVAEAGGCWRALVKEFHCVQVADTLTLALSPQPGSSLPPILCGLEIQAEGW
jgi:outer membrane protein assembly factor BamB